MNGGSAGRQRVHSRPLLQQRGFTIVETLIVLAVSMLIFISAVALVNGKQRNTEFNQSIRQIQGKIEQTINDVGSGYYVNDGSTTCAIGAGRPQLGGAGTDAQGSNKDCLFMGKVMQFGIQGSDNTRYNIYTLVGLKGSSTSNVFNLQTSKARVIAKATGEESSSIPNAFEQPSLQYGLSVASVYYTDPSRPVGSIGFVSNLSNIGASDGSQRSDIVAFRSTAIGSTAAAGAKQINDSMDAGTAVVNPPGGVFICLASGGTNKSGLISIGADGGSSVELRIFNGRTCT